MSIAVEPVTAFLLLLPLALAGGLLLVVGSTGLALDEIAALRSSFFEPLHAFSAVGT